MNKWTSGQQNAIDARGGTLLVSAAAGSGKTAVLVQRVIERLTDPINPSDADHLLVVTFTKAAAAEMRERIAQRLSRLLSADPFNSNLQRQQVLLANAHISTVHSFCSELVRENFYKLNIPADFRISEEGERNLIRQDAILQVLEENYEKSDTDFFALIESFSSDRDDKRMIQIVLNIYDFIRSHPFPEKWLREKAEMYTKSLPTGESLWGKVIFEYAKEVADYCIHLTKKSLSLMVEDETINEKYASTFQADLKKCKDLQGLLEKSKWDTISEWLNSFEADRLPSLRGYTDDPLKVQVSDSRKEVKSRISALAKLFDTSEEDHTKDIEEMGKIIKKLFEITLQFSITLEQIKTEKHMADYDDLEHWALRLLVKDTDFGAERTEDAKKLSLRFDEVMVDEYQDTNEAQDMLFRAISQNEENLFMVGDVKQSIYTFRQAMPKIFLERRSSFQDYQREKDLYPARIILDKNFRSRPEVTAAVNFVFRQLMSENAGDVEYSEGEELVTAATYEAQAACETQMDILDITGEKNDVIVEQESRHIAKLIQKKIADGFVITEAGKERPVTYRDFCILLRSANKYAPEYAKELQFCAVPAWADISGNFFETTEVASILSLLRSIDNPMQDIPLAATLMSPIYAFSADDMADIRIDERKGSLYMAFLSYAQKGNERALAFLEELEEYRTIAATLPTDRLLNFIYEKSSYLNMVQAMSHGELRLENLHMLLEHAKRYEASGYHGLSGFIRLINRLQEQNADLPGASTFSENANVVRIMSIHKSKGLEFPICIIAGSSREYNTDKEDILLHSTLGIGAKLRDKELACRYTTLPREAIRLEKRKELMSEELRILYVAMTRAREKLILIASLPNLSKELSRLAASLNEEEKIPAYTVRNANKMSDWLLSCVLRHPSGKILRELANVPENIVLADANTWKIQIFGLQDKIEEEKVEELPERLAKANPQLLEKIEKDIAFQYTFQELCHLPTKVTASELAAEDFEEDFATLSRPAFLSEQGLTPAERGTALHEFMQFSDYSLAAKEPKKEIDRLIKEGFITKEQGAAINLKKVKQFFSSSIAKRILQSPNSLREMRFTVEIPAHMVVDSLSETSSQHNIVLQGAIDCVFEEDGKMVVVDYKTDHMTDSKELWKRYQKQMLLYQYAIEQCTDFSVKEVFLYSFHLNTEVSGEYT